MKCASALSTLRNTEAAMREVIGRTAQALDGEPADLAFLFASMHHADSLGKVADAVRADRLAHHVLGCTGESIVGDGQEVEGSPALSLWAARLPGVHVNLFRLRFEDGEFSGMGRIKLATRPRPARTSSEDSAVSGPPEGALAPLLLLGDPFTFPADPFLKRVNEELPGLRVLGGMASGSSAPGQNRLVWNGEVYEDGAVAVALGGPIVLRSVVSQGCRPIGRPLVVTRTEGNMIRELGRRPALEVLREIYETLSPEDRERLQQGLHIGRVINEYQETFVRGDFLVRNVIGGDEAGGIAITDVVRVGQTVQFHLRDEETADEDLRSLLESERQSRPDAPVKGALLFSCNGRGTRLFSQANHDVTLLRETFGTIPVAGFFAMGELGPVGGLNFVHGYTASVVLFEETVPSPG